MTPFARLLAVVAAVAAFRVGAEGAVTTAGRAEATAIIADAQRIVTPNGVERLEKIRVGGIEQWVSIRGTDRRNPVLLLIHGGPGYVSIPMSWWFSRGWEEYFTVVQWHQRAAGKTHLLTDPAVIAPTLTLEPMVADAEEMTAWFRREFGKDRVFVMGHSWGSCLGVELARHHPDWLQAYIGVGQIAYGPKSERRRWRLAMDAAGRTGNAEAVRELNAIAPYAVAGQLIPVKDLLLQRKWLGFYGGAMAYRKDNSAESALARLSPDYTAEEIRHVWDGTDFAAPYLLPTVVSLDPSATTKLACPLILFEGRRDWNVNSEVAAA